MELEVRKRYIPGSCDNLKSNTNFYTDGFLFHHIWVNEPTKTLICIIPKVSFAYMTNLWKETNGKVKLRRLTTLNVTQRRFMIENYPKMLLTREPMARLWSAYNDKFVNPASNFRFILAAKIKKLNGNAPTSNACVTISFPEFVNFVVSELNSQKANEHWSTYHTTCRPCDVKYDYVLKMEHFRDDFQTVKRLFDIEFFNSTSTPTKRMKQTLDGDGDIVFERNCFSIDVYSDLLWKSLIGTGHVAHTATMPKVSMVNLILKQGPVRTVNISQAKR